MYILQVDDIICVAGQIGLVPGNMQLVKGGIRQQCQLALRHIGRIVKAMDHTSQFQNVVQGTKYMLVAIKFVNTMAALSNKIRMFNMLPRCVLRYKV